MGGLGLKTGSFPKSIGLGSGGETRRAAFSAKRPLTHSFIHSLTHSQPAVIRHELLSHWGLHQHTLAEQLQSRTEDGGCGEEVMWSKSKDEIEREGRKWRWQERLRLEEEGKEGGRWSKGALKWWGEYPLRSEACRKSGEVIYRWREVRRCEKRRMERIGSGSQMEACDWLQLRAEVVPDSVTMTSD